LCSEVEESVSFEGIRKSGGKSEGEGGEDENEWLEMRTEKFFHDY